MAEIRNNENEVMEAEIVEENKETFIHKVGSGIKKHSKKILIGSAMLGLTGIGYALGRKRAEDDFYDDYDDVTDEIENEFSENDDIEEDE